jgi:hypothetical protein
MRIAPIRKQVTVRLGPAEAFRLFTEGIDEWWPGPPFSVAEGAGARRVFEPRVGGSVHEAREDGEVLPWGEVRIWEPPYRFVMSWHPGLPSTQAQEVEVRFVPLPEGTRVELEHRDWWRLGEEAERVRATYEGGWDTVLEGHFVPAGMRAAAGTSSAPAGPEDGWPGEGRPEDG